MNIEKAKELVNHLRGYQPIDAIEDIFCLMADFLEDKIEREEGKGEETQIRGKA